MGGVMMNSFTSAGPQRGTVNYEFEPMFDGAGTQQGGKASPRRKVLTDDDIAAARAQGVAEGLVQANASIERAGSEALRAIAGLMQMMLGRLAEEAQSLRTDAAEVAIAAARVVAGTALDEFGEQAVADIVSQAVAQLRDVPRLVVRVSPDLAEIIEARLIGCAREAGFSGEIAVRGDPDAQNGDCILDWGDGTITHNREAAFEAIAQAGQSWLKSAQSEGFQIDMFQT
jgi:flagellar assembly protein FliH